MVTTSTTPPASGAPSRPSDSQPPPASARAPRPLGRRPSLPAGRAIIGGFLVTVAAIGTFAAYANANAGPAHRYVVAATPVRAGQRLTGADLREVALDLPDGVEQRAFSSIADLEGAVALAPLDENQLIAPAAVRTGRQDLPAVTHELSFALEREKALAGRLQRGELIDLVATYGSGGDAYSRLVVRRARVVDVDGGAKGTVGSSSKITITVALDAEEPVLEALHALEVAKVTLVRTTGDPAEPPDGDGSYRPSPPSAGSAGVGAVAGAGAGAAAGRGTTAPGPSRPSGGLPGAPAGDGAGPP